MADTATHTPFPYAAELQVWCVGEGAAPPVQLIPSVDVIVHAFKVLVPWESATNLPSLYVTSIQILRSEAELRGVHVIPSGDVMTTLSESLLRQPTATHTPFPYARSTQGPRDDPAWVVQVTPSVDVIDCKPVESGRVLRATKTPFP